jgi:hypothetical protein
METPELAPHMQATFDDKVNKLFEYLYAQSKEFKDNLAAQSMNISLNFGA